MFSDKITTILAVIIGLAIGFSIGYLGKALADRIVIAELTQERDAALLEKNTMQDQWEIAVNELNEASVLLNDTLAALELLRNYQSIDNETRKEIDDLEDTFDEEGEPTEETYDEFRKLVEEMNRQNQEYNTGSTSSGALSIMPFIELRENAEEVLDFATYLLFQYRED